MSTESVESGDASPSRFGAALVGGSVQHLSCLGVGVGPANLSLASLMWSRPELTGLFLERRSGFGWHDGQQMPGATLQVSMLKDLVSLTDPTSPFSFLAYLHDQGRIYHYLNARFEAVPRMEFRNYLAWAAARNPSVVFGEEVLSVDFDTVFRIRTSRRELTADHVSVGVGNQPWIPPTGRAFLSDPRVFHVCEFTSAATDVAGQRVTVIGGGQSGAEAFLDLINRPVDRLPRRVCWVSRRPNFFPIDDSPFTNDYYMPDHSDYFASLSLAARQQFNLTHLLTSDGISEATLRQIYQQIYTHHYIHDRPDLIALYPHRELTGITQNPAGAGYELALRHGQHPELTEQLDSDIVIFATGFAPHPMPFLQPLRHRLQQENGEIQIDTHYAAVWDGPSDHHLFLQNAARTQRGLADPNLSLLAWRSQRILDSLT
ncbi:MAG TPA: SidA/IucD/PvdA family monooxygenase, partial [Jatrophihabitans sp.]|nr:SidA/IucD/PvdA family monooxygenase [Jatrophihabitans sp.]